jgi:hypothetical protein
MKNKTNKTTETSQPPQPQHNTCMDYINSIKPMQINYDELSEKEQIKFVNQNIFMPLYHFKNPSEKVQLAAINKNYLNIQDIKNPSEKVQFAAVKINSYAIKHIKKPTKNVQLFAIEKNYTNIYNIKKPYKEVKILALQLEIQRLTIYKIKAEDELEKLTNGREWFS